MEHGSIPHTVSPSEIGHMQHALHFVDGAGMHQAGLGLLGRNGKNAPTLCEQGWHPIRDKAQKGLDGDEPGMARPGTVVPLRL
jgi:hypothetical protein